MDRRAPSPWIGLAPHLFALALVLVGALTLAERSTGFSADEGSYAIQAAALRGGSWSIDWSFRSLDPEGAHFPYHGGRLSEDAEYAYLNHPAWPRALAAMTSVLPEEVGLRALSMISVMVATSVAYFLARQLGDARSASWAFWMVASSPILANGLMIWAHAPAAAVAGLAALALAKGLAGCHPMWWVVMLVSFAAGVFLRSEMVLFAAAAAVVLGVLGIWRRSPWLVGVGIGTGGAAYVARLLEIHWIRAIAGGVVRDAASVGVGGSSSSGGWFQGRVQGVATSLFQGAVSSPAAAVMTVLGLGCVALAVLDPKRLQLPAVPLLWVAVALAAGRVFVGEADPARGLLAAWPVGLLALLAVRSAGEVERVVLAVAALFALGVFATQYDDGGGLQWGGRYLMPIVVPLGVAAAAGLRRLRLRERRASGPVAALLVALSLVGLVVTNQVRDVNARGLGFVSDAGPDVVLVSDRHLGRLDWEGWPERCWMFASDETLASALALLDRVGIGKVTYVQIAPQQLRDVGYEPRFLERTGVIGTIGDGRATCPPR